MKLEIQGRLVVVDPACRDLIERRAAELRDRCPDLLQLHVVIDHSRHHHTGVEDVLLLAHVNRGRFRAAKQREDVRSAVHAAFDALDVELARHHAALRLVSKRSGARPRGSIQRIFREAGYGFIDGGTGRGVFFHRGSLHGLNFDQLEPGTPVGFELEEGRDGPQASRVFPAGATR